MDASAPIPEPSGEPLKFTAEFPDRMAPLFEPHRYKILYGGRGGAKSWSVARALLLIGSQRPLRVVCAREIQRSIKQSVHKLLSDQIGTLGLSDSYKILETEIRGPAGTEFSFHGLRHNIDSIKSLEGADVCWVEEGQSVSANSWQKLIPTVRKPGSEIWISFNPELESDPTYNDFVLHPPADSLVLRVSWRDNPWWTPELESERARLEKLDPDAYRNVYEGECIRHLEGTIYARELTDAESSGRIGRVPYDAGSGVGVWADLGWGDMTSLIFVQREGFEFKVLHAYQDRHHLWQHFLRYIQDRGYVISGIWLPHDAENGSLSGDSVAQQTRKAGFTTHIVPRENGAVKLGINAARTVFPRVHFDRSEAEELLHALRHYRYGVDEHGHYSDQPAHDEHSHFADAFRYFATTHDSTRTGTPAPADVTQRLERARAVTIQMSRGATGLSWLGR